MRLSLVCLQKGLIDECEVKGNCPTSADKKEQKKADRFIHLGLCAVAEAMKRANIGDDDIDRNRFGVCNAGQTSRPAEQKLDKLRQMQLCGNR